MKNFFLTLKGNQILYYYLAIFVFFGFIAYNVPLTGDDWTWGSQVGIDRLHSWFKDYNGRYVGNILEILVTRIDWFRFLVESVVSTLLVLFAANMTETKHNKTLILLSFFLFIMIPTKVFAQTFGWTAGYINYVPSIMLLLLYLFIVKNILEEDTPSYSNKINYLVVPLGLVTTLIVEHVTLFAVFTGAVVIIYTYFKHKRHYFTHWAYFISTIIGSAIMFTNGAYLKILNGEDSYRSVRENTGIIGRFYTTYKESMNQYLFIENFLVQLIISLLVIILILRTQHHKKWIEKILKPLLLLVIIGFDLFLLLFKNVLGSKYLGSHTSDFEAIITLLYFITIVTAVLIFIHNKTMKVKMIYYISGIVLLTAPFVFITPYGPRCVFGTYTFMVLFIIELIVYLKDSYEWKYNSLTKALLALNVVIIIAFTFIIGMNGNAERERIQALEKNLNKEYKVVEMRALPYPQFHHMSSPNPKSKFQYESFKRLHKVPKDVEIKIIPYFQSNK